MPVDDIEMGQLIAQIRAFGDDLRSMDAVIVRRAEYRIEMDAALRDIAAIKAGLAAQEVAATTGRWQVRGALVTGVLALVGVLVTVGATLLVAVR